MKSWKMSLPFDSALFAVLRGLVKLHSAHVFCAVASASSEQDRDGLQRNRGYMLWHCRAVSIGDTLLSKGVVCVC